VALLLIYVSNEALFAATHGYWGPMYILLREMILPVLSVLQMVMTGVEVVREVSWVRRGALGASTVVSVAVMYLQWSWQGALFLPPP
jgi:hypothetical protein